LALIEKAKNLVSMMHKVRYIHGNLWALNIFVAKENKILFVDFNFVEKIEFAKYSHFLNKENLK
jgi:tRNA A-37 threonylcarbamoyl transferase component Bud32